MRAAQSAIVVALGSGLALFGSRRFHALWTIPLAIVAAKFLFDPIVFEYYTLSASIAALLAACIITMRALPWLRVVFAIATYLIVFPFWANPTGDGSSSLAPAVSVWMLVVSALWVGQSLQQTDPLRESRARSQRR
jgi:hypothetical protein